jgi:hypothetical protein
MVEAAGIEPLLLQNTNPMMVNDFSFYCVKTFELPRRFFSPGVPSSPPESSPVLEIFWRRSAAVDCFNHQISLTTMNEQRGKLKTVGDQTGMSE